MPKPVPLTPAVMEAPPIIPPTTMSPVRPARAEPPPKAQKAEQLPLQIRLPREEVRAIKIAAAEREQTVSDFMLACFHAYMKREGS